MAKKNLSSIKRAKQNLKRRLRNLSIKSRTKTFVKKAKISFSSNNLNLIKEEVKKAVSQLDRAAQKGVIHKNTAARKKSRLMKKLHNLEKNLTTPMEKENEKNISAEEKI